MKTLSGSLVGKGNDTVVIVGDDGKVSDKMRITGHWYYVQKCVKEEMISGIALSEKTRYDHPVCLVLAVGDKCGQKKKKYGQREREMGMMKWNAHVCKPMDKIILPDDHPWGVLESPYSGNHNIERWVHEDIIKGVVK